MLAGFEKNSENDHRKTCHNPMPPIPESDHRQRRQDQIGAEVLHFVGDEGRDELDFEAWMRKDMEYIDTWFLSLDWKILLLTIPRVLSGRGANRFPLGCSVPVEPPRSNT